MGTALKGALEQNFEQPSNLPERGLAEASREH